MEALLTLFDRLPRTCAGSSHDFLGGSSFNDVDPTTLASAISTIVLSLPSSASDTTLADAIFMVGTGTVAQLSIGNSGITNTSVSAGKAAAVAAAAAEASSDGSASPRPGHARKRRGFDMAPKLTDGTVPHGIRFGAQNKSASDECGFHAGMQPDPLLHLARCRVQAPPLGFRLPQFTRRVSPSTISSSSPVRLSQRHARLLPPIYAPFPSPRSQRCRRYHPGLRHLAISLASLLTTSSHLSEAPFKGLHLVTQPPAGVCLAVDVDVRCRLALRARRWDRRPRKIGIVRIYVQVRLEAGKGFDEAAITPELRARPRGGKQGLLAVRDQCPMADQRAHRAQLWLETTTASSWRVTLARTLPAGCRQARRCATHDPTYDAERQIIAHQLVRTSAHFLRIVTMDPFVTTETTIEEEFGEPFVGPRKT
ncbi:hypothetical protein V8E36_009701 [Tilletia maclaganii]